MAKLVLGENKMLSPPTVNILAFRKCLTTMSDEHLVGIAKTCKALSENVFTTQFAECAEEWRRRHRPNRLITAS
jgi:hypothetical protein